MKIKKIKGLFIAIVFFTILFIAKNIYATEDVTKKLYQDITINSDGSVTVKEVALLSGEYNGRSREIRFKNTYSNKFTGIYSNFAGNTDIYDGSSIKDIKIYDISQNNFKTIEDINKIEKEYKKVKEASNGKYGVYTLDTSSYEADFKIYCPSKKKKVFYMEYTITDAVVIHNDVAELYWNVIGSNYREKINDFQLVLHLPGEDNDLRVWTHGPLTGINKILNNKTVSFQDRNVSSYEAETIRVMFNKNLVPNGTKKSGVNGKENILKYEQNMANTANYEREQQKYDDINTANQAVMDLEEYPTMYRYKRAIKCTEKITDINMKSEFNSRIQKLKNEVNNDWKRSIESEINRTNRNLTRSNVKRLKENIEEGFDETAKEEYMKYIGTFIERLDRRDTLIRIVSIIVVIALYSTIGIIVICKSVKLYKEKRIYNGKYYRDFPSDDNPYVIEYLMKKQTTNLSISATILSLVTKKVIELEENVQDKNTKFILKNKEYSGTESESKVLEILFKLAGKDGVCYINNLKDYGKTETNAKKLTSRIDAFKKAAKFETEAKEYFTKNGNNIFLTIMIIINYIFSLFMMIGVFKNKSNDILIQIYIFATTLSSIIFLILVNKNKNRTEKGKLDYSKWLAHKRFLKDFSMLDEKDLPEITLWEKYLVTATVLGCADKVQERMKLYINNYDTTDTSTDYLLMSSVLNNNLIRTIDRSVNKTISTANSTISASQVSSGGGYGGGSSGGGGFGGRRRRRRSFLKIKMQTLK